MLFLKQQLSSVFRVRGEEENLPWPLFSKEGYQNILLSKSGNAEDLFLRESISGGVALNRRSILCH